MVIATRDYYEILQGEPPEKRKPTIPKTFVVAVYHWLRYRSHGNNRLFRHSAEGNLGTLRGASSEQSDKHI